jgi:hypothetical protein
VETAERELVLKHLNDSRERLRKAVAGLSKEQFDFTPDGEQWSVAYCVEHIAVVENGIQKGIQRILETPAQPEREAEIRAKDRVILETVPARKNRVKGPPQVMPNGRWPDIGDLLGAFEATRARSLEMASNPPHGMHQHFFDHPIIGPMNCYQWLLFLGTHCERHVKQMEEVMAHPAFPRSSAAAV